MLKIKAILLVVLAFGAFGVPSVHAAGLDDLLIRDLERVHTASRFESSGSLALNLTYVGASTEAVIFISSGSVEVQAPFGTVDSNGSFDITLSTTDTFGELCNLYDALDDYRCSLLGGKSDDDSAVLRDQLSASGTNDLKAVGGFNVKFDSGSLSGQVSGPLETSKLRVGITPPLGKRVMLHKCTGNGSGVSALEVFGKVREFQGSNDGITRNDATKVWSVVTANDTDATIPETGQPFDWIEFAADEHVVVAVDSPATHEGSNFLQCYFDYR